MKRIAIVVQRCHASVVGGSEALAWQYARLLSNRFDVEVLTSTASDYVAWKNDLPVGVEMRDGIPVRRFPVTITRDRLLVRAARAHAQRTACNARDMPMPRTPTGAKRSKTSSSDSRDRIARSCTRISTTTPNATQPCCSARISIRRRISAFAACLRKRRSWCRRCTTSRLRICASSRSNTLRTDSASG